MLDHDHVPKKWERLVRFYVAFWNGSGMVERGLGADAATQAEHVGRVDLSSSLWRAGEMISSGEAKEWCVDAQCKEPSI